MLHGRRPNIVLVLTDDQGYGDASCNGNPVLRTPALDRLHREGVHFEDFHVSPTCAPTRCALMTGRHEFRSGVTHTIFERERMSLDATTFVELLREGGYRTGIFGKWHLGDEDAYQPERRGFEECFIHGAGGIGQSYPGSCGDAPGNGYNDPCVLHNGTFVKTDGYCTDVFFDRALAWIEEVRGEEPFFAYVSTNAPHVPLVCPEGYEGLYRGKVDDAAADFFGMIANIDDNVGRLLTRLEQLGIERDTLVVFVNDNGGTEGVRVYNAGMKGAKVTQHNGGTRAMSLWRWPGTLAPGSCPRLTAHVDLFPTFLELAGVTPPEEVGARLEGSSLVPLLSAPEEAPWDDDRTLVTHVGRWEPGSPPEQLGATSVRSGRHLLVRQSARWTLHDLVSDPGEETDLSGERPDVVRDLAARHDAWWAETLPCLVNEEAYRTAPARNPFHERYWRQYRGPGPNGVPPPEGFELT